MTITTKIIQIGNSKGIRIPKTLLDQLSADELVELKLKDGVLIVQPVDNPRQGWDQAFSSMAASGDDQLFIPDSVEQEWDQDDWMWE